MHCAPAYGPVAGAVIDWQNCKPLVTTRIWSAPMGGSGDGGDGGEPGGDGDDGGKGGGEGGGDGGSDGDGHYHGGGDGGHFQALLDVVAVEVAWQPTAGSLAH